MIHQKEKSEKCDKVRSLKIRFYFVLYPNPRTLFLCYRFLSMIRNPFQLGMTSVWCESWILWELCGMRAVWYWGCMEWELCDMRAVWYGSWMVRGLYVMELYGMGAVMYGRCMVRGLYGMGAV